MTNPNESPVSTLSDLTPCAADLTPVRVKESSPGAMVLKPWMTMIPPPQVEFVAHETPVWFTETFPYGYKRVNNRVWFGGGFLTCKLLASQRRPVGSDALALG